MWKISKMLDFPKKIGHLKSLCNVLNIDVNLLVQTDSDLIVIFSASR